MSWLCFPLAALSGLLIVLGFPPYNVEGAIWFCLVPALLGIHLEKPLAAEAPRWQRRLVRWGPGYLLGLIAFGGLFWWIGLVTAAGTAGIVVYFALYPALWIAYARWRWPRVPPYTSRGNLALGVELASLWTVFEWLRGWLFTGFGWNGLGVALWQTLPLAQGARLGGVLFLTWVVVLLNVIATLTVIRFYHELRREQKMKAHLDFNLSLLLLAVLFSYGFHRLWNHPPGREPQTLRYVLVQPDIPQLLEEFPTLESVRRHVEMTAQAAALRPDLVVWPESTVGVDLLLDVDTRPILLKLTREADFSLLAGSLRLLDGGKVYNTALLLAPRGKGLQFYDKSHLVPFGEYAPLADRLPFMRRLVPFNIDFSAGEKPDVLTLSNGGARILPRICFEDTLPGETRRAVKELQPDLLVNITNDGWFRTSPGAEQHLANAIFRTVETGRPLLRCGNNGISAAIDPQGRILSKLEMDGRDVGFSGVLAGEIGWGPAEETPYLRWGDWIVGLSLLILAVRLGYARWGAQPSPASAQSSARIEARARYRPSRSRP